MEAYPRAAMGAMKVQDVMLQAMAKKITWWQAAEILGISDRHMRRLRERHVEEGYNGLLDRLSSLDEPATPCQMRSRHGIGRIVQASLAGSQRARGTGSGKLSACAGAIQRNPTSLKT